MGFIYGARKGGRGRERENLKALMYVRHTFRTNTNMQTLYYVYSLHATCNNLYRVSAQKMYRSS